MDTAQRRLGVVGGEGLTLNGLTLNPNPASQGLTRGVQSGWASSVSYLDTKQGEVGVND